MSVRGIRGPCVALVGLVGWLLVLPSLTLSTSDGVVLWVFLMVGPGWSYLSCLASTDDDYPIDAGRGRAEWLQVLPWTFVVAPLVIPNMILLVQFFRDSRADHGLSWLGSGRSRPGEGNEEQWR